MKYNLGDIYKDEENFYWEVTSIFVGLAPLILLDCLDMPGTRSIADIANMTLIGNMKYLDKEKLSEGKY